MIPGQYLHIVQRGDVAFIAVIRCSMMARSCSTVMPFSKSVNISSMLKPAAPPNRTNFLQALTKDSSMNSPQLRVIVRKQHLNVCDPRHLDREGRCGCKCGHACKGSEPEIQATFR